MKQDRVVGAILVSNDRVLLGYRCESRKAAPCCWDVPGGHIEDGESGPDALLRELEEELDIRADSIGEAADCTITDPQFELSLYLIRTWSGELKNAAPTEHDEIKWFAADELDGLQLADPRLLGVLRAALEAN